MDHRTVPVDGITDDLPLGAETFTLLLALERLGHTDEVELFFAVHGVVGVCGKGNLFRGSELPYQYNEVSLFR